MNTSDKRRHVQPANIGGIAIGAPNPVVVQSMTTTPSLDTDASAAQAASLAAAGAQLVRLTAQGVAHAANLAAIKSRLAEQGIATPLVADIHFNPAAAFEAALHVEKVRINPGNFFDPGRTFRRMVFTEQEYAAELAGIREKFIPFLKLCREHSTAIRIGVNHGSLSDRIMSRFGDGAEGMAESAMEFLRICRDENFNDVVVSIKASDVPVMTDTVRHLVERMEAEGMAYPLHLGVTEAGNALEGRIKSAVGIGSLLIDGIGDTIRVSLSEAPENEIPVARELIAHCMAELDALSEPDRSRRKAVPGAPALLGNADDALVLGKPGRVAAYRRNRHTSALLLSYPEITDKDRVILAAAADLGSILLDGYRGAVGIASPLLSADEADDICRKIIQAAGLARFQAEIVACPGCGRTLFALPEVLEEVKKACLHLRHLKIAVMGCIVNGPGEMAGADYGYVGAAAGKVSIYRGTECVQKNIEPAEALPALIALIKADGRWIEKGERV
ncbi:MAG: (E)-4-hydroxy-3-methylbut-2-enyl-diphosphate synthase [Muribaculaceae bacterium]|nr:(E)-4-hydroxy-3-methylbut-2-enyl-diphosphate synthase [Muribaculaceae bacterium]